MTVMSWHDGLEFGDFCVGFVEQGADGDLLPEDFVLEKGAVIKPDVVSIRSEGAEDGERDFAVLFGQIFEIV